MPAKTAAARAREIGPADGGNRNSTPPAFRKGCSAQEAHRALMCALGAMRQAERCSVLWFDEISRRRLYRELGHATIHQYAASALGFSPARTSQYLRLAAALARLPRLRHAVATGGLSWTKARELVKVATPATQQRWLRAAQNTSRAELERQIAAIRGPARRRSGRLTRAAELAAPQLPLPASDAAMAAPPAGETVCGVHLQFSPLQRARYEALVEQVRRARLVPPGHGREELILAALEALSAAAPPRDSRADDDDDGVLGGGERRAGGDDDTGRARRHAGRAPYQIVVQRCDRCGGSAVATTLGPRALAGATAAAVECDAVRENRAGQRRQVIPPAVRRRVLARDGYRCRAPGCAHTRFLEVHHLRPRALGGGNDLDNLITLCSSCHRFRHENEHAWPAATARPEHHAGVSAGDVRRTPGQPRSAQKEHGAPRHRDQGAQQARGGGTVAIDDP